MDEKYINVKQAAQIIGLSTASIRALIKKNELPCSRLNSRTFRIKVADLESYIIAHKQPTTTLTNKIEEALTLWHKRK